MNIIIAGAGKVGFNLAKTLCIGHNVTIIDKNSEALHRIQESLDILPINGDIEDSKIYQNFIDKKIDLFIAVTNVDNINIISTVMADSILDIDRKFVRVQKHFYDDLFLKERLRIDMMVFPIKITSRRIVSLLNYPYANNVKFFKYTNHRLISLRVSQTILPMIISSKKFIIAGIERGKIFFIPDKEIEIIPNDLVYLFGLEQDIRDIQYKLTKSDEQIAKKCVVFGANELGISIAKELLDSGKDIKLIDKDLHTCEKADEILEGRASIINAKYGTNSFFEDEGLDSADVFISATHNDEYNITKCLEAKENGIPKVMAINNELEYYSLMHSLGISVVRGPKISAYNTIMEHINSTGVVIEKGYCGSKASILMRKVFSASKLINKKIKPLKLKELKLIILREDIIYEFTNNIILEENDLIVAFFKANDGAKVKKWIYEL